MAAGVVTRFVRCPMCEGTGDAQADRPGRRLISEGWCPKCDGAGRILDRRQRRPDRRRPPSRALGCMAVLIVLAFGLGRASADAASRSAPDPTTVPASTDRPTGGPSDPIVRPSGTSDLEQSGAPSRAASQSPASSRPVPAPRGTPRPLDRVTREGIASTYGEGWDGWIAWPGGPGYRLRVCGAGGCRTVTSNDAGPDRAMQRRGRIIDLDVPTFEHVCGVPWRYGLCPVVVTVLRRPR